MSIISNEHKSGSPFEQEPSEPGCICGRGVRCPLHGGPPQPGTEPEGDAPKLPSDHEQITRMMAAFTATMAALEPLSEAERLRVLNAIRILTDRGAR